LKESRRGFSLAGNCWIYNLSGIKRKVSFIKSGVAYAVFFFSILDPLLTEVRIIAIEL
jgi:hypothetical protein